MDTHFETLEAEVLKLPPAQRTKLLDRVVASLDADAARDAAWDAVAAQREAESVEFEPLEKVLARLRDENA
ncbi:MULTISPECIES: addiction module protein [Roseateles]|uniref:Addiction module protein n=1 Tax=Pelomonas caseinilytica TaxID=2906763 RepID=A0ABS8X9D1_9BURK|nr:MULTISPECIES: addiction module protein [unclassified Roseateles]MCE4536210.1 addiction module protein [Pelomonas sp. P7]HEV6968718.1 addiction module protein [Roseateles sp.]